MVAAAGKATKLSPWKSPMAYTVMISERRRAPAFGDAGAGVPVPEAWSANRARLFFTGDLPSMVQGPPVP